MTMPYDSTADTQAHIELVRERLAQASRNLEHRGQNHDASKFREPEKSGFDRIRPLLDDHDIESEEYKQTLRENDALLRVHYDNNSHHPEHYPDGIAGMTLLDVVEMLCDWSAASQRKPGGALNLEWARKRFGIEPQLFSILVNTARELGFVPEGWEPR